MPLHRLGPQTGGRSSPLRGRRWCRFVRITLLFGPRITPGDDASQSFGLFFPQLKLSLNVVEGLPKQTAGRHRLVQINRPVPLRNVGESQPQVSLRHDRRSHASTERQRCTAGHTEDVICGDPSFIEERSKRTVRRHTRAEFCQTHSLICLKHSDGAQCTSCICLCPVNFIQL